MQVCSLRYLDCFFFLQSNGHFHYGGERQQEQLNHLEGEKESLILQVSHLEHRSILYFTAQYPVCSILAAHETIFYHVGVYYIFITH